MNRIKKLSQSQLGFTLVEITVALLVLTVIAGATMFVLNQSTKAKRVGDDVAEAQQNARSAMNTIIGDIRTAGYGLDQDVNPPIEVASEYRLTVVLDRDRDSVIDDGERVTYFMDPDQSQAFPSTTRNPYDYVLRRVENDPGNPNADPAPGAGEVVCYLMTQRSSTSSSYRDTPVFGFTDENGGDLLGANSDPAGADYGYTVEPTDLGIAAGGVPGDFILDQININIITETASPKDENSGYRQFSISSSLKPRNFSFDLVAGFSVMDSTVAPEDTTTNPPSPEDTTEVTEPEEEILPPYEPPIRISTARVLSLDAIDLGETDALEGSFTSVSGQHDVDLVLGTKAGASNNLSVWFNGQPDRYTGETLYNSVPNYYGTTAYDITSISLVDVDGTGPDFPDAITASAVSDVSGGFHVWLNQNHVNGGYLGVGPTTTTPTAYYSSGTGKALCIATEDFDNDGDIDVAVGTRTGANQGKVEIWENAGNGSYTQDQVLIAGGEVNALVVFDYNGDGRMDLVAGTKNHTSNKSGTLDVFKHNGPTKFGRVSQTSTYQITSLAVGDMNLDGNYDVIAGTKSGQHSGTVQFWKNSGSGFALRDEVAADNAVLSVAVGQLDLTPGPDVAAGNEARSIQAWFCDASSPDNVLPANESWADANVGGEVHAVEIVKVEYGAAEAYRDVLNDLVVGTAVSATEGEIVIYLNPYVWTITP